MRGFPIRRWMFLAVAGILVPTGLLAIGFWKATHCTYTYDRASMQLRSLEMKIQSFSIDTHRWPRDLRALLRDDGTPGWRGPYAREADLKDAFGGDIQYEMRAGGAPVLRAQGRNHRIVTHEMDASTPP